MAGDAAEADAADEIDDRFAIPGDSRIGIGRVGVGPGDTGKEEGRERRRKGGMK